MPTDSFLSAVFSTQFSQTKNQARGHVCLGRCFEMPCCGIYSFLVLVYRWMLDWVRDWGCGGQQQQLWSEKKNPALQLVSLSTRCQVTSSTAHFLGPALLVVVFFCFFLGPLNTGLLKATSAMRAFGLPFFHPNPRSVPKACRRMSLFLEASWLSLQMSVMEL